MVQGTGSQSWPGFGTSVLEDPVPGENVRSKAGPVFYLLPSPPAAPALGWPSPRFWPGALINYRSPRSRACYARLVPVKACTSEPILSSVVRRGREGTGDTREGCHRAWLILFCNLQLLLKVTALFRIRWSRPHQPPHPHPSFFSSFTLYSQTEP